ncbi:hypothetical protein E4U43_005362 [Claviceps pusilla]|uniref:Uncharacterized protein n=1 Tax=Claviceps pusilla TaxID=123648 RepID=A0A9P7SW83_9HYPO|nr:hypothetical protein E4U43_005362 [Claviceps pusilla]
MHSDADADAAAVAQAMGFSSFGTQDRPLKKRRYNAAADSISSAATAPQLQATGSNTTPLAAPGAESCANAEEIDLHDEDDEVEEKDDHNDEGTPLQASQISIKTAPAGLPARPAPGTGFVGSVSSESHAHAHAHAPQFRPGKPAQRSHNELWYKDYYDSTSNENPWERLEKAMGLETKGIWVSRSEGAAAAAAAAPAVSLAG